MYAGRMDTWTCQRPSEGSYRPVERTQTQWDVKERATGEWVAVPRNEVPTRGCKWSWVPTLE